MWLWDEAPTNAGEQDTGIDLVALDEDGTYWAIQAKCYSGTKLALTDVGTFFANALADKRYQHYMIADTASGYTSNLVFSAGRVFGAIRKPFSYAWKRLPFSNSDRFGPTSHLAVKCL